MGESQDIYATLDGAELAEAVEAFLRGRGWHREEFEITGSPGIGGYAWVHGTKVCIGLLDAANSELNELAQSVSRSGV